jgi:hypothetical protein
MINKLNSHSISTEKELEVGWSQNEEKKIYGTNSLLYTSHKNDLGNKK